MNTRELAEQLDYLIAQSIEIGDFASFAKHQKKIETIKLKLDFAEAQKRADERKIHEDKEAAEKAERERQQRITDKVRQRLEKHLNESYEKTLADVGEIYKISEELFKEVCNLDFNLEPDFVRQFRPEFHVHQMCRCLCSAGFRPVIDAFKSFHLGPLADEVRMSDYLGRAANDNALISDGSDKT